MGIFSRRKKDRVDDVGTVSEPQGDGPVTLSDRVQPGGEGSPATNQGKTEPLSPTTDHAEPLAVPDLADMSVGTASPQLPDHPAARQTTPPGSFAGGRAGSAPRDLTGDGADPDQERPDLDTTTSTGRAHGPLKPEQQSSGEAHRVEGLNGRTPEGESIETDTEGGATRMGAAPPDAVPGLSSGHGDTGGSPAPGDAASLGTSEDQPKVEGVRLPEG
jgi:hypothetical protein